MDRSGGTGDTADPGTDPYEEGSSRATGRLSIAYSAIIIVLATLSVRSVNNMVVTTLPFLAKYDFGFSNVMVGAISAAMYLSTFVVTSYLNPMLRSETRRKVFIGASAVIPASLLIYYFSGPFSLWPVTAAAGLAFGFVFPNIITSATLHRDHMVQMRLLAIYSVSLSLSLVMGPSLETWLLTFLTYKQVFLPFMGLSFVGLAVSPFIGFPRVKKEVHGRKALGNSGLISSILSITIYNVPFAAIASFLVIFAVDTFNVSSSTAYSVFIYFFATSFAARLYMAIRPFRSLFPPLIVSAFITVASLSIIPFVGSFTYLILIMAIIGIPHGMIFPMASMLVARGTKPEERNVANSYFLAYNNILFVVIPVIFGFLSVRYGFDFSFFVLAVSASLSTVLLTVRYRQRTELFRRGA